MPLIELRVEDRIARIAFNRPEKKNAISYAMRKELHAAYVEVRDNPDIWVAILTGNGDAFSTGHDLSESLEGAPTIDELYDLQTSITKPMIAAIDGACLAQGGGMALSCDIRYASERAFFGWPQVKRGICSISGPTLLARKIPLNFAMEYLLTGDFMSAQDALELRLVNRVFPAEELWDRSMELAGKIAANAPLAVRAMKQSILESLALRSDEAYRYVALILERVERTEDAREGMRAFLEKRAPVWHGR
jgi:enoyl-CoA hydratase/carnithine racemase